MRLFWLFLAAALVPSSACAPPRQGSPDGAEPLLRGVPVGAPESALIGVDGGALTVDVGGATISLEIFPRGLAEDVEITLTPIEIQALPASRAVRFSPDALVFESPALLTIAPAPGVDLVGLTFDEGAVHADLVFVAPDDGQGVQMPIEHFSAAAVASRDTARKVLDADSAAVLDSVSQQQAAAFGLGEILRSVVEPAVKQTGGGVADWQHASALLESWAARVQNAGLESEVYARGGSETLAAARERLRGDVLRRGLELFEGFQQPRCRDPGNEVDDVEDWITLLTTVVAALQVLGAAPPLSDLQPCATYVLVVDGPTTLSRSDDRVVLDIRAVLEDPNQRRETVGDTVFVFEARGATAPGPRQSRNGTANDVVFLRRAEISTNPRRPRAVVIDIEAQIADAQRLDFEVPPVTFIVSEPIEASIAPSPASLGSGGSAQLCGAVIDAEGVAVTDFETNLATDGPGTIPEGSAAAGACLTYLAPASVTQQERAEISGTVIVDGAPHAVSTTVDLVVVGIDVTSPSPTVPAGAALTLSAEVTGTTDTRVTWSASAGQVTTDGVFSSNVTGTVTVRGASAIAPNVFDMVVLTVVPGVNGTYTGIGFERDGQSDPSESPFESAIEVVISPAGPTGLQLSYARLGELPLATNIYAITLIGDTFTGDNGGVGSSPSSPQMRTIEGTVVGGTVEGHIVMEDALDPAQYSSIDFVATR